MKAFQNIGNNQRKIEISVEILKEMVKRQQITSDFEQTEFWRVERF